MPKKCCRARAMQQNNTSFAEALAAICRGNFMVVTCINLLLMTDYYLIFVTGTAHVQKTFGVSLSMAGLSSGIMVIGCLVGRFATGNQISAIGGKPCLLAGLLLFATSIGCLELAHSLPLLFIQRFVAGFGIGVAGTATGAIVAYVVPVRFHGLGIGIFSMSAALALALEAIDKALADADALILSYGIPATVQTTLLARLASTVALYYLQGAERMTDDVRKAYDGVIDTLLMAREMFPGKSNNLDALCRRLEVDNSGRTLHGALLDAEILADVAAQLGEFTSLVGDLMQLSRDDAVSPSPEPLDFADVVAAAVDRVKRRGPNLTYDVVLEPMFIVGEPDTLERAVTNLLDNAVKFSPPESVVRLSVTPEPTGRFVIFCVVDEGPGIALEE